MMLHNQAFISKENLDLYFLELAKQLKKKMKSNVQPVELIIVGGASIVINYKFRKSTIDVDCFDPNGVLMNDVINSVASKYSLPNYWINTDFTKTKSFSFKLIQFSKPYKTYLNGTLNVRTIDAEYLLAMKIVSARKYRNDYSDIVGIINELKQTKNISIANIENAIIDLYGSLDVANKEAYELARFIVNNDSPKLYEIVNGVENNNKKLLLKEDNNKIISENDVENVLSGNTINSNFIDKLKEQLVLDVSTDIRKNNVLECDDVLEEMHEKLKIRRIDK